MRFRTQFDKHQRVISESGTKEIDDYEKRLDSKGRIVIRKKPIKKNIYNRIQEHEGEDIKSMMQKLSKQERRQFQTLGQIYKSESDVYDLREVPTSIPQAIQMAKDTKTKFEQLPADVKKEFNNNYMEFQTMASKNTNEFETKMAKYYKKETLPETETKQKTQEATKTEEVM